MNTRKMPLGAVASICAILAHAPHAAAAPRTPAVPRPLTRAAAKEKAPEGPAVTFTGFHVERNGTSQLTVQLTEPVPVTANVTGKTAEYLLTGATIPRRNNKNPLITSHFVSLVTAARLVPEYEDAPKAKGKKKHKGKPVGVRVVCQMREDAKPEYRIAKNNDGTAALVITFPKPKKDVVVDDGEPGQPPK